MFTKFTPSLVKLHFKLASINGQFLFYELCDKEKSGTKIVLRKDKHDSQKTGLSLRT